MKIFILRHGQAEAFSTNDFSRRLTSKGAADTQQMVTDNQEFLSTIRHVYASPLLRAQQTAEIATELLGIKSITTNSLLEPDIATKQVFNWLVEVNENSLIVSHLPLVGLLANQLCGFQSNRLQFNTSSLIGIECDIAAPGLGNLILERHI